jgi:RsiW-degrading membrane proteinase PrsW (M82 family)
MVAAILAAGLVVGVVADARLRADRPQADPEHQEKRSPDEAGPPSAWEAVERAAQREDWPAVWRGVWRSVRERWSYPGPVALALLTGLCWLCFALQAVQPGGLWSPRCLLCGAGFLLGILSVGPTLFAIAWQEQRWGLADRVDLVGGLRDNILGVGLREELCKFACGLPLLPWLVWRRDAVGSLMAFGCVGLGFAASENISYIAMSGGTATVSRLLMPAPAHLALTGLAGLAAYRAGRWPRDWGLLLLAMLGVLVLVHGLYDAFMSIDVLQEYSLVSMIVFILLVRQFFHELHEHRDQRRDVISLTANFLFCVSLTTAAVFVYVSAHYGWQAAADQLVTAIVTESVMVYLFLREMPETLVTV